MAHPMQLGRVMTNRSFLFALVAPLAVALVARTAHAQAVAAHDSVAAPTAIEIPAPRPIDPRLIIGTGAALPAPAPQAQGRPLPPTFSRADLAYWGGALALGVVAYALDERVVDAMPHPDSVTRDDGGLDYATIRLSSFNEYQAFYGAVALYGYGRIFGKENLAEVGLHASEAALLAKVGMDVGRGLSGRSRPVGQFDRGEPIDHSDFEFWRGFKEEGYGAFPSRHTTGVAAVFSALAFETAHHWPQHSKWVTPLAIATPAIVGLGRMYTGHHWSSDVVAGAALGTWLGWKTVRYTHNHPNNWLDRVLLGR